MEIAAGADRARRTRTPTALGRGAWTMALCSLAGIWALVALVNGLLVQNAADQARATARNTATMAAAYVQQSLDAGRLVLHGMQALLVEKDVQDEAGYRAFLAGPAATQVLRDRIAGPTTLVPVEGGPHATNMTHPAETNRAILQFLAALA